MVRWRARQFVIKPGVLPLGRAQFHVQPVGGTARTATPLLVTFSDMWAVNRFEQTVEVLRYFPRQDLVTKLKAAPRTDGRRRGGISTAPAIRVRRPHRTSRSTSISIGSTSRTCATPSPRTPDGRPTGEKCTSRSGSPIRRLRSPVRSPPRSDGNTRPIARRCLFRTPPGGASIVSRSNHGRTTSAYSPRHGASSDLEFCNESQ